MMRHNVSNWIAWLGALLVTISVASPAFAQTTDKRAVDTTTGHSKAKVHPRPSQGSGRLVLCFGPRRRYLGLPSSDDVQHA